MVRTIFRLLSSLLLTTVVIGAAILVVYKHQDIIDWWNIQHFTSSTELMTIETDDTMTPRAMNLLKASKAQYDDRTSFNTDCNTVQSGGEKSIVLGCYTLQRIFVYNVTDSQYTGVVQVTTAHEMLHAAYDRMSTAQKNSVNAMLAPVISAMHDKRILQLIRLYNQQEPGQLYNEMHSILGTEDANLSPQLETYYKQYFTNRSKVVSYSNQYEQVFVDSQSKLDGYDQQLSSLKVTIDENNSTLENDHAELISQQAQLDAYRQQNDIVDYQSLAQSYNSKVQIYNNLVDSTKQLIALYNEIVIERNNQATAQNKLYNGLSSQYSSVQ